MSGGSAWPRRARATNDRPLLIAEGRSLLERSGYPRSYITDDAAYGVGFARACWHGENLTNDELREEIEITAMSADGEIFGVRPEKELSARLKRHARELSQFLYEHVERNEPRLAAAKRAADEQRQPTTQTELESEVNPPSSSPEEGFPQDPKPQRSPRPGTKRDKSFDVRLSDEELAGWKQWAKTRGLTLADAIRGAVEETRGYDQAKLKTSTWERLGMSRRGKTGETQ